MSLKLKKAGILLFSGCLIVLLTGCASKVTDKSQNKNVQDKSKNEEALPVPTGKVDDTVNAIEDEVNSEQAVTSQEEQAAKSAASNNQAADDLANTYDENEF